jgi:hypothetical protein
VSGGSYDYAYRHVEEVAGQIASAHANDPLALAFADHLRKVATAMHAVEWADSCDWSWEDAIGPMRAVVHPGAELEQARAMAARAHAALGALLTASGEAPGA